MHATPKGMKTPRWDQYRAGHEGEHPPLPDTGAASYLTTLWQEVGRVSDGANGAVALLWSEIDAFARSSGGLEQWEQKTLRAMSAAYIEQLRKSDDPFVRRPWDGLT